MAAARLAAFFERHVLLVAGVLAALAAHPTCNLLYRCGCAPFWSGGVTHCNIHRPSPPHCPWCSGGALAFAAVAAAIVATMAGALVLARRRYGRRLPTSAAAVVLGFALGALLAGLAAALIAGYPTVLGIPLRP